MKLFTKAILFASHHWRRSSPASFMAVQSPNFPFTQSLCAPPPTCELWSPPFTRVVFLLHIAIWCSTSGLYNSTLHGWYTAVTLISPTVTAVVRSVCSLLVHKFSSSQCFSSQDDGRLPRVDHHCLISAFSQPFGAISLSLSPYLRGQHLPSLFLHVFKTLVKRLLFFCLAQ